MLLFLFIFSLHIVAKGQIPSNINDIICTKSQTECVIDCTNHNIHCHGIDIYSSTNTTIINCLHHSSCSNIKVHCENSNKCILKCTDGTCSNSTLLCNSNSNGAICECQGPGCASTPIITNNMKVNTNTPDDNKYTVDRSLMIMFFVAFFAVVLCCFCVLVVALCMGILYFGEKKNEMNLSRQIKELKQHRTISIISNSTPKSETTLNIDRMTLSRSNKNGSYDTTVSAMVTEDRDEKDEMITTNHDIITIKQRGTKSRESETINEEEDQVTEQQEGDKPQLDKFDSEDLYIMPHATLQYPCNNEDNECIESSDCGDDMSTYSIDGHITSSRNKPCNIMIDADTNKNDDITIDISAQLPTSPDIQGIADGVHDSITKHPPKDILLRPPTVGNDAIPKYHGIQNSDAGSDGSDGSIDSDYTTSIEGMNEKSKTKTHTNETGLQVLPETFIKDVRKTSASFTTFATYNESELRISRSSPPPQSRSESHESTDLQSESTFTIKSAIGTGNNSDRELSRTSMSLNSAAAVRIAFPDGYGKKYWIPFGISSVPSFVHNTTKAKHRNYYSEILHNSKRNPSKLSMTPSNSPMEKPMIISKAPSTTAMVPSLPSSPTPVLDDIDEDPLSKYHRKRHQSVPSYSNSHDHSIILMEPHINGYRTSSKSTGNIESNNKIKIKRNSKPILKVYRNQSNKSNIVLPTNEFNKNNEMTKNVEWNTTIMMSPPPPPPIVLDINHNKRTRNKMNRLNAQLAAIIPNKSSFISNIIK